MKRIDMEFQEKRCYNSKSVEKELEKWETIE